ncbi:NHL repeat-containing protein [Streptomyces sp. NPDC004658]|uniref:NHL repeat-containing protein n=1 Tax=Streptomyces sp. NPDC004658 TaxID=3154672 RepID=UPI00339FD8DD
MSISDTHGRALPAREARHGKARARVLRLASATVAAACAAFALPAPALGAAPASLQGTVTGAGKPLRGAQVTLMAGSRSGVTQLGQATTDTHGSFRITYTKPADGVVYAETTSQQAHRLKLRSVVGFGSGGAVHERMLDKVTVNELTTVAATYAFAQFGDQHGITGPAPGLQNAAATSFSLADPTTGKPAKALTGDSANQETLTTQNTLANLVSLCVTDSARCDRLIRLATPAGGSPPPDTVQAVLDLARNPTQSPARLEALARAATVFTPALTSAPRSWILAVRHPAPEVYAPGRIAFDAKGNVWATNNWKPGTRDPSPYVTVQDPTGRPTLGSPIGGGGMKGGAWGLAIDHSGAVWAPSYGGNAMSKYSASGKPLSPSAGWKDGDLVKPQGVAVDQRGNIWIANSHGLKGKPGVGSVVVYPHGDPRKAVTITDKSFNHPFAVQIDGRGRAWVTNSHLSYQQIRESGRPSKVGGSVTVIGPDFKPVTSTTDKSLQAPIGLALDSKGNAWVANFFSSAVTEIRPNGTVAGVRQLPKRVFPWSVAIDGQDRVWVAGFGNSSVTLLCGVNTRACPSGASVGTVLSPTDGFRNAAIQHLTAVQIDSSGNAWVANNWSKIVPPTGGVGLVELIGAATPVCTPLTPLPTRPSSATTSACPK